jgi:F-type H+-transporting ATPase subunit delta
MANLLSIARPYALAAFDSAREAQQLPAWQAFLEAASQVARDSRVKTMLAMPEVLSSKQYDLFHDVLSSLLDEQRNNFLKLLAQNKRLIVLPEVLEMFNAYYAALEKISKVRVVTAVEAQEDFRQKLTQALTKRLQRDVTLNCEVDPAILGGAVIHIGDRVIDGSIRGKLSRMLQNLTG